MNQLHVYLKGIAYRWVFSFLPRKWKIGRIQKKELRGKYGIMHISPRLHTARIVLAINLAIPRACRLKYFKYRVVYLGIYGIPIIIAPAI